MLSAVENKMLSVLILNKFTDSDKKSFKIPSNYGWKEFFEDYLVYTTKKTTFTEYSVKKNAIKNFPILRSAIRKISFLKSTFIVDGEEMDGKTVLDTYCQGMPMSELKEFIKTLEYKYKAYNLDDNYFDPGVFHSVKVYNKKNEEYLKREKERKQLEINKPEEIQLWVKIGSEWSHWEAFTEMSECQREIANIKKQNPHWQVNIGGPKEEELVLVPKKEKTVKVNWLDLM